MITVTLAAQQDSVCPTQTVRIGVKRLSQCLQRMSLNLGEWTYTIEQNPKETGYHIHMLQKGPFIKQTLLQEACYSANMGIPDIRAIKYEGKWTATYGLKGFGAAGYGMKKMRSPDDGQAALKLNNGRLERHSRAFFEYDGERLNVRDYERLAINTMNGDKPVAMIGIKGTEVDKLMADKLRVAKLIRDVNLRKTAAMRAMR